MIKIKTLKAISYTNSFFPLVSGHILERYDVILYGFFANMLAPIFFPGSLGEMFSVIASLGAFAAGYLMRPLGAIIFGHIGDRFGRRQAFLASILFVSLPTLIIGILPTYNEIGFLAPLMLITCRLLQGACIGGEYTGAAIFFHEYVKANRTGLSGSLMCSTAFLGGVLGTILASLCLLPHMPTWGWRIPFILGGMFGIVCFFYRFQLKETVPFREIALNGQIARYPLANVIKTKKINMLCAMAIGINGHIPFYMVSIYMGIVLAKHLYLSPLQVMTINIMVMSLWMLSLPLTGFMADIIGKARLMSWSSLAILILAYPAFWYLNYEINLYKILFFQFVFTCLGAAFLGPSAGRLPELFPVEERYSGIAFGLTTGQAFLGGTAPMLAAALVAFTHDESSPALLLMLGGIMGWFAAQRK